MLIVGATGFYTLVGQLVPQKEVQPPKETELKKEMTADELVKAGKDIMEGKGLCTTCHTIGKSGALRFPDLDGIGARAATRRPGHSDVAVPGASRSTTRTSTSCRASTPGCP